MIALSYAAGTKPVREMNWSPTTQFLFVLTSADKFCRAQPRKPGRKQRQAQRFWNGNRTRMGLKWDEYPYDNKGEENSLLFDEFHDFPSYDVPSHM
jgi:hypothetical protein